MSTVITTSNDIQNSNNILCYRLQRPIKAQNINIHSASICNQYYNVNQFYNTIQLQFNSGQYTITMPSSQYSAANFCSTLQGLIQTVIPSFTITLTTDFYTVLTSSVGNNFWFKLFGDDRDRLLTQYLGFNRSSNLFSNNGLYSYQSNNSVNVQVTTAINVSLIQPNIQADQLSIFLSIPVNANYFSNIFYQQQNDRQFDLCSKDQQIQVNDIQFQLLDDNFNPLVFPQNQQYNISWLLR